jgi:hypothetical protein
MCADVATATCGNRATSQGPGRGRHRRHRTPRRRRSRPLRYRCRRLRLGNGRRLDGDGFLVHRFKDDLPTNRADLPRSCRGAWPVRRERPAWSSGRSTPRGDGQEGLGHRITLQIGLTTSVPPIAFAYKRNMGVSTMPMPHDVARPRRLGPDCLAAQASTRSTGHGTAIVAQLFSPESSTEGCAGVTWGRSCQQLVPGPAGRADGYDRGAA